MALDYNSIESAALEGNKQLSEAEKAKILADAKKLIDDTNKRIKEWADTVNTNAQKELNNFVKINQDLVTAIDFTNPGNEAAINAEGKEPIWVYLKKQIDKANANGGEVETTDPPPPPFDFCIQSLAQVLAAKGTAIGSAFLSNLKAAVCAPEGGIVDAINGAVPGFKDWYKDADQYRKDKINADLKAIADAKQVRKDLFKEISYWKDWDQLLAKEINEFKKTTKEDLTEWLSGTENKNDPNYQLYKGLVEGGAEVLQRCYDNNPQFKDLRKVVTDTEDVIKDYTDGVYTQLSNLNSFIAETETAAEEALKDLRDYDPCTLVEDGIGKVQNCYDCYSNYLKWKTDDTGKVRQPVCNVDWCVATDGNGSKVPDWLNTPVKK